MAEPRHGSDAADAARVDDLRQRLRSLGYLDAGVDRFVLAPASRAHRPAVIALFASARIGTLAALLLGPAAAVGLVSRMPGLVTGPRDAVVAAIYLGVLFGVCAAVGSFLVALPVSWIASSTTVTGARLVRRARALSIGAGTIVGVAALAYLTLWWRTASPDPAWSSPLWTAFALALAAATSLALGHAVTVTALAVAMARPGRDALDARVPTSSWKASMAATAAAFAGAAVLLFATARDAPGAASSPTLTVSSSGARVVVLAIDGFDAHLHERLRPGARAAGAPNLFAVLDGARADLTPSDSRDPARLWTTVATGVEPGRHGVEALETRRVAGLQGRIASESTRRVLGGATDLLRLTTPALASNVERRVKTFWEVAEQAGLRTAVVNWWASWPAPASGGAVISDRGVLRLERGGQLDAEIAPATLYDSLKPRWPEMRRIAEDRARAHFSMDDPGMRPVPAELRAVLTRSAELDASMAQLADAVSASGTLDLVVVYLPGLDIAQHSLLGADSAAVPPSELEARVAALQRYYAFLDALAGAALGAQPGRTVFVVTQPGRMREGPGLLAGRGHGLQTGARASGRAVDVAPTILHALGVPAARDLDGRVLTGLYAPDALVRYPVRDVDTYGVRGAIAAARGGAPLDQEMIDRLRSLGYVK